MIAKLQSSHSKGSELEWVDNFNIGNVVEGKVHETKDFGVVVSFRKYNDVFGFITHYQLSGITLETGSTVRAAVLDVARIERLVDLSLKPILLMYSKERLLMSKRRRRLSHQSYLLLR
ncbi:unnamed protein product [Ilex paraguariensis]|uniref:S1 motif domain-containing protein n=1 Tax=Ilex paraguariensis TaxID=185542 RepID=A0ABC8R2A8_9AQUA